ncbi:hypothetical protein ACLEVJ_21175 [Enterobacter ludwigii]|jgi:hypothetical protein|uniref:YobI family P-loop NTPase n=1 Tax=Enterobacter ludwigii TaxID=299767 RepID=UPI00207355D4
MVLPFGLNTAKDWFQKTLARSLITTTSNSGAEDESRTHPSFVNSEPAVSNNEFQTLTPIIDPDKEGYKPYFKALDYALGRDDVKNIAITGPYGAGKSSVILSYLKMISARKTLRYKLSSLWHHEKPKKADEHVIISLANFETDETLKSSESLSKEQSIEYSILQQILYKVDKGSLPDSRVERIHTRSVRQILTTSFFLFCILILAIVDATLLFPQKIVSTFSLSSEVSNFIAIHPLWRWGCITILSFIICWYLLSRFYRIGFFDRKIALDKVNLLKAEIAAEKQSTASLLNLYIDEIVYFFLKTKYRIVVFEDLDRLNNGHIFIKLREINQVVNNSKLLEKKPIKFVFAVREDLLKDAETQTKFFDFIVPIIPAVDSENAYDILNSKVVGFNSADKQQFFKKVSLYLTDMRVMNNVINEFNIFKKLITGELSDIKLFSLIMYKNLCTKDFTQLDNQKGFLFKAVQAYSKKTLHELYYNDFEITLSSLKSRVEQAREESLDSKEVLRGKLLQRYLPSIYLKNASFYLNATQYHHNGVQNLTYEDLVEHESLFIRFLENKFPSGVVIVNSRNQNYDDRYDIPADKRIDLLQEYKRRIPVVEDNNNKTLSVLMKRIDDAQEVINSRRRITLRELCEKITLSKFREWLSNDKLDENETAQKKDNIAAITFNIEFLFFMLSNGYIEQDYMQYRSIFHAGALSKTDNIFIQKVASKVGFDELKDFHLDNVPNIFEKLDGLSFKFYEGVLHPDIMSYLIGRKRVIAEDVISNFLEHGSKGTLYNVIQTYYYECDNGVYESFLGLMFNNDKALGKLMTALDCSRGSGSEKDNYEQLLLSFIRFGQIKELYQQIAIHDYLQGFKKDTTTFKFVPHSDVDLFCVKLNKLHVVFERLNEANNGTERDLLRFVAENYLYEFNIDNLTALYNVYSNKKISVDEISRLPYSLIVNQNVPCLISAINKNIDVFISECLIHSSENVHVITTLLNLDVTESSKENIIENMQFEVQQLSIIENTKLSVNEEFSYSVYDLLIKKGRVAANWSNIFDYMHAGAIGELLWSFVNMNSEVLASHKVSVPDESIDNVINYFYSAVDKPDDLYAQMVSVLSVKIEQAIDELPLQKFKSLCTFDKVSLSKGLYEDLLTIYEGQRHTGLNECLSLIIKHNIGIFEKNIDFYLKEDEDFDNELIELLFNDEDIALDSKVAIIDIIWPHYSDTFFEHVSIKARVNKNLLLKVAEDDKRLVFLNHLLESEELPHDFITRALMSFVAEEYNLLTEKSKRAKVSKSDSNELLLHYLTQRHYISSYRDKGQYLEVYHHRKLFQG